MERYQDKVVLITGAGDVAEAAAKRLLCEGAKVAFSDFSQEALDAAISGLKAEGWGRGAPYGHKVRRAEV